MKTTKRVIAFLLCVCLLAVTSVVSSAADGTDSGSRRWFTQIDGVRIDGAPYLSAIDFSAVVEDPATLSGKTLRLYQSRSPGRLIPVPAADDPTLTRDDLERMDWIANFVFSDEETGVAVLDLYPHAQAQVRIECPVYVLAAEEGVLFDDTEYFTFTSKEYFQNAFKGEDGKYLQTCVMRGMSGDNWFSGCAVTKAEGETVYEMELTLERVYKGIFDTFDPEAEVEIYGVHSGTFCCMQAYPIALDAEDGVLTIELRGEDGTPGVTMFGLRLFDNDDCYDFVLETPSGLLSCGAAEMRAAKLEVRPGYADGMPMRNWSEIGLGRYAYRFAQNIRSNDKVRSMLASTVYMILMPVFFADGVLVIRDAVEALGGRTQENRMAWLSVMLSSFGRMLKNV